MVIYSHVISPTTTKVVYSPTRTYCLMMIPPMYTCKYKWTFFYIMRVVYVNIYGRYPVSRALGQAYRLSTYAQRLQTTQHTHGGAVTVVRQTYVDPSRPQWAPIYRWIAGTAPHKSEICRDYARSDNYSQRSLDLRYLPQINTH